MPRILLLPLLLAAARFAAGAQEPQPQPLTVQQAVRAALRNDPRLAAAVRDTQAAEHGVGAARALANPEISFTPAITEFGSDEELLVVQPLELNGARAARAGAAKARLRIARAEALGELRSLVFATKSAYADLFGARGETALARDLLQTTQELERLTRRQVEIGTRPAIDQTQAAIEVARAMGQVTRAEGRERVAEVALATRIGGDPDRPIGALAGLEVAPATRDRASLVAGALGAREDIVAADASTEARRQEARLGRAEGLPDLAPQIRATRLTRGVREAGIGIAITLPLFDHGARRGRVRQAEEAALAEQERARAVRRQVRQEVEQAITRVTAEQAVVALYEKGLLADAKRLLEASRIGYEEGKTALFATIEAQRTYRAVQNDYLGHQVALALALAELERATGAVPPDLLPSGQASPRRAR